MEPSEHPANTGTAISHTQGERDILLGWGPLGIGWIIAAALVVAMWRRMIIERREFAAEIRRRDEEAAAERRRQQDREDRWRRESDDRLYDVIGGLQEVVSARITRTER